MTDAKVLGGKSVYGAAIGILMLEAQFPRIPGDMGNALTWPFPVHYKVVRGASPDRVVRKSAEGLLDHFIAAARELEADGVDAITTNCGFLALHQAAIAAAVNVPVATSSLMQINQINQLLPAAKSAGILTISANNLTPEHLTAVGVSADTPVMGTDPDGEFSRAILDNRIDLDVGQARRENIEAAQKLAGSGDIGAIVLECTNMIPYAADIRAATSLPVFSIYNLVCWLHHAVSAPSWPAPHNR
jgi:hypothetical protein